MRAFKNDKTSFLVRDEANSARVERSWTKSITRSEFKGATRQCSFPVRSDCAYCTKQRRLFSVGEQRTRGMKTMHALLHSFTFVYDDNIRYYAIVYITIDA